VIDPGDHVLAEGPAWNAAEDRLSWVDIERGQIFHGDWRDGSLGPLDLIETGEQIGCAVPLGGGRFLCALQTRFATVEADGRITASRPLIETTRRWNDGKVDPQGRFVVGSLHQSRLDGRQSLVRLEADGAITTLDEDLNQSNGLAWSPDGATLYSADTPDQVIYQRSYGPKEVGERQVFAHLAGRPDGLTTSADGHVWVTIFDGERVDCLTPAGEVVDRRRVSLPGLHPTSVEFAGPDLSTLVITTGFPEMPDADKLRRPDDGLVLAVSTDTRGVPTHPWRAAPLPQ
jgi:sugar lactone lactonase YvrE